MKEKFRDIFKEGSCFKAFLASVFIMGLGYGIYKGIIDNYMAEIVHMGKFDRGVSEFFREFPGILIVFILALFYTFSAQRMYKIGAVIMLSGMIMQGIIPPSKGLVFLAVFIYSLGEHIQLGMKSTLTMEYSLSNKTGVALGFQNSFYQIGTLLGFAVIIFAFRSFADSSMFKSFFFVAAAVMAVGTVMSFMIKGESKADKNKSRFYFRKKFSKYYMLEVFYGARKQVFLTFGPYVLILFYGANASVISLLFAVSAISCFFLAPVAGKIIDKVGYRAVMISDTLILVIVCFFYGFAHHIFSEKVAFIVCCMNFVLDSVISLASMAANVYVRDISDSVEEMKATVSTGLSVNHVITVLIALFGGMIWQSLGIETLFVISAVLGLCNSAYACTVKTRKEMEAQ